MHLMRRLLGIPATIFCAIAVLGDAAARAEMIGFRVQAESAAGEAIEAVHLGDDFFLALYATDLRAEPQGVFSAYADLFYDADIGTLLGEIDYSPRFNNGKTGKVEAPGFIDEAGGIVTNLFVPTGGGEQLVLRAPLTALNTGLFTASVGAADAPFSESLLFGRGAPVPVGEMTFEGGEMMVYPYLLGDIAIDGAVDLADFNRFKSGFGSPAECPECDLSGDGRVDLADFNLLKDNFGATVVVPEPTALSLLALAGTGLAAAALASSRRRR